MPPLQIWPDHLLVPAIPSAFDTVLLKDEHWYVSYNWTLIEKHVSCITNNYWYLLISCWLGALKFAFFGDYVPPTIKLMSNLFKIALKCSRFCIGPFHDGVSCPLSIVLCTSNYQNVFICSFTMQTPVLALFLRIPCKKKDFRWVLLHLFSSIAIALWAGPDLEDITSTLQIITSVFSSTNTIKHRKHCQRCPTQYTSHCQHGDIEQTNEQLGIPSASLLLTSERAKKLAIFNWLTDGLTNPLTGVGAWVTEVSLIISTCVFQ